MRTQAKFLTVLIPAALIMLLPSVHAQEMLHARVSFESGGAMVRGTADDDWSYTSVNTLILPGDNLWVENGATFELEMSGGSFLRMGDGSKAEVVDLPPNAAIRGWTGAFYVQRIARSTGDFVFYTPACRVEITKDSHVRIDVVGEGATTVSVRWGSAVIRTDVGGQMRVGSGKRAFIDPGFLPSTPVPFDRNIEDEFDSWSRGRAERLAVGFDKAPEVVSRSYPIGVSELSSYGEWVYVDQRPYWRPTVVVDYVPYRNGYWSYVPGCGHVWVGDYSFCYVTSHYGRWTHHARHGWIWSYCDGWSPAWVASVRYGDHFVWSPLGVYDRPVVFGDLHYTVDGFRFSVAASSYCGVGDLLVGPCTIMPCHPRIVSRMYAQEVHIWNIYAPGATINVTHWYGNAPRHRVRDYSPRRVIRGPDIAGPDARTAAARSAALETSLGRRSFTSVERTGANNLRTATASTDRTARMRSVAVNPSAPPVVSSSSFVRAGSARSAQQRALEAPGASGGGTSASIRTGKGPSTGTSRLVDRGSMEPNSGTRAPAADGGGVTPSHSGTSSMTRSVRQPGATDMSKPTQTTAPASTQRTRTVAPSTTAPTRAVPATPSAPSPSVRSTTRTVGTPTQTPVRSAPPARTVRMSPMRTSPTPTESPRMNATSSMRTSVPTTTRTAPSQPSSPTRTRSYSVAPSPAPQRVSPAPQRIAPAPAPQRTAPAPAPAPQRIAPSPSPQRIAPAPAPQRVAPTPQRIAPAPSPQRSVSMPSRSISAPSGGGGSVRSSSGRAR